MYTAIKTAIAAIMLTALAACATPGFDYTASIAPGNPQAATLRTVAVERFRGPLAGWYGEQFEAMLTDAQFQGQPWFDVGLFAGQSNITGVYAGEVDIARPYVNENYHTYSTCVSRDKETKKCLKKKEVEKVCLNYTVDVAVTPQLLDVASGEIIHRATYTASASEQECFKTGHVVYKIRRGPNDRGRGKYRHGYRDYERPGYRPGGDHIVDRITASALIDTVWQARRDIAPYNKDARATILTEAETPALRADPRFEAAVSAVRDGDFPLACARFAELRPDHPAAPAVLHNLGACAEASGEALQAQLLYAEAATQAQALGAAPARRVLKALDRISERRSDGLVLDSILPTSIEPRETLSGPQG